MRMIYILCVTALSYGAFARDAQADQDRYPLILSLIESMIIPGYEDFAVSTLRLHDAVEGSDCTNPAPLRAGFHLAMDAWQTVGHIRFGPIMQEDRVYRVQFWPDKRNITSRHLAALLLNENAESRTRDGIVAASVAVQGFPALERILFETPDDQPLTEAQCDLATSIALNLSTIAADVAAEWKGSYRATMLNPGTENPDYLTEKEVLRKLQGSLSTGLQILVQAKLTPVLGKSKASPKPRLAETWRSARMMKNVAINIDTLLRLYEGGDAHQIGFDDVLLQRGGQEEHAVIAGGLTQAMNWAQELDQPINDLIANSSQYSKLSLIAGQLAAVRAEVDGPLVDALDLSLGFNALDGD